MKKTIEITLFKNLKVIYEGKEADLSHGVGKKLINLFEYLIINKGHQVSQEEIAEVLWPESTDTSEVIKYTVFRLRKTLSDFEALKDLNLIITSDDGYMLNDEYDYDIDCFRLGDFFKEYAVNGINSQADYKKAEKVVSLYTGRFFLTNNCPLALTLEAESYSSYFSNTIVLMSKYLIGTGEYQKMMKLNYDAIMLEPFYEGLHYYYIKGMIEMKDYHRALKYYDEIYEKFFSELGMGLSPQFIKLYDIIKEENDSEADEKQEIDSVVADVEQNFKDNGGFYCNYEMFKHLYEITVKNAKREGKKTFLALFTLDKAVEIDEKIRVFNRLKKIVEESVRSNDILTKVNKSQLAVLLVCNEIDNAFLVVSRITTKFYKKFPSNKYRLNYSVKEVDE